MSKQTAVEWFIEELFKKIDYIQVDPRIINQAKAMEREQQRLIYEGLLQNIGTSIKQSDLPTFEQYYNSTYKGGEQ